MEAVLINGVQGVAVFTERRGSRLAGSRGDQRCTGCSVFTEGGCSRLAGRRCHSIVHCTGCLQRNVGAGGLESVVNSGVQGVAVFTVFTSGVQGVAVFTKGCGRRLTGSHGDQRCN